SDTDSDSDGTPDCLDRCPYDDARNEAGVEVCDGVDNDCDGLVDEDLECDKPDDQPEDSEGADCAGVIGGEATIDHCGVCGGNGTSCSNCEFIDLREILNELEGQSFLMQKLILRLLKRLHRTKLYKKKYLLNLIKGVKQLHLDTLEALRKELPEKLPLCSEELFCQSLSNRTAQISYENNLKLQNKNLKKVSRKLRLAGITSGLSKAKKKSKKSLQASAYYLAQIPPERSQCF
ncbi:MAG: hypothetical protein KDD42_08800, partial [Bdellovibrionales bacterium]|nr:hypothetical protein [Bdellovibrionales bacterium]